MKITITFLLLFVCFGGYAQSDSLAGLTGLYRAYIDPSVSFIVKADAGELILEAPGEGEGGLERLGHDLYWLGIAQPATLCFIRDSSGRAQKFTWTQERKNSEAIWKKQAGAPKAYAGRYQFTPSKIITIIETGGRMLSKVNEGPALELQPQEAGKFLVQAGGYKIWYAFQKDEAGNITQIITHEGGAVDFNRAQN